MHKTINRAYDIVDFRNDVFGNGDDGLSPDSPSSRFLTKNGFTAVKYPSVLCSSPYTRDDFDNVKLLDEIYYPEIDDLVKKVTGCKKTFIHLSMLRGPPREKAASAVETARGYSRESAEGVEFVKPQHKTDPGPCIRVPHADSTALGDRQLIRGYNQATYDACVDAGIIAAEVSICEKYGVKATEKASQEVLAKHYNADGVAGPRYASFSIWRPLKKVTRDPLTMAPRAQFEDSDSEIVAQPYDIRTMGHWGDCIRQLIMLRVKEGSELENKGKLLGHQLVSGIKAYPPDSVSPADYTSEDEKIKFYYCSEMESDEVLLVKLADSAAQGENAPEADGPMHASPDLREFAYGDARESLEIRLLAVW